jgi:hypothetical protein
MEIKVSGTDVISTIVTIGLDLTIDHEGQEHELSLVVKYEDIPNFGTTNITWEVTEESDDSIFGHDTLTDVNDQIDDFVQEYVYENIGRM